MITYNLTNDDRRRLIEAAQQVRSKAYVPYSHYQVGAALLTPSGKIFTGCNVENSSYGATICAERTAVVKAVSEGEQDFVAGVIITENGGSPCGICRQVMFEFAPDMTIILVEGSGKILYEGVLHEMLLLGFGPDKLRK
ncbi:MAG: cytidine deaminase [Anaerolineae bacterium]|nr:cytidine deaminase [Anaerolineae bacterium]